MAESSHHCQAARVHAYQFCVALPRQLSARHKVHAGKLSLAEGTAKADRRCRIFYMCLLLSARWQQKPSFRDREGVTVMKKRVSAATGEL